MRRLTIRSQHLCEAPEFPFRARKTARLRQSGVVKKKDPSRRAGGDEAGLRGAAADPWPIPINLFNPAERSFADANHRPRGD